MINVEAIKNLMEEQDLSQKAFALTIHVTEACVSRVLSGKRSGSLEFLEAVAKAFPDIDLRSLLILDGKDVSGKEGYKVN